MGPYLYTFGKTPRPSLRQERWSVKHGSSSKNLLITVTPTPAYVFISSKDAWFSSKEIVFVTSFPGARRPLFTKRSIVENSGKGMPIDPIICASCRSKKLIGTGVRPPFGFELMPIWTCLPRFVRLKSAFKNVSWIPSASMETFAPPFVISRTASGAFTCLLFTTATAPSSFATANFSQLPPRFAYRLRQAASFVPSWR